MERIEEIIAQHGIRVKELNDERKEVLQEIEERQGRLQAIDVEIDREVFAIHSIEELLPEDKRGKSWVAQHRNRKPGDPLSVVVLLTQILEAHPRGLNISALLAEMRKLGFQTDSKNPSGILRSTLDRRAELFHNLTHGRWCLKKYAPPPSNNVVQLR